MTIKLERTPIGVSCEVEKALQAAQAELAGALDVIAKAAMAPVDTVEAKPNVCSADGAASSVRARQRTGEGKAPHEVFGGHHDDDELPPSRLTDHLMDSIFLGADASGMPSMVANARVGGSYLDRRLLSYYLDGMSDSTHFLKTMDFYRGEEMWDGRYNYDHEARSESVLREASDDREWARQDAMHGAASSLHSELAYQADLYADQDYYRQQQASDDYYRYNS